MQTPKNTILRDINPGKNYHFGLDYGIINMLKRIDLTKIPDIISVSIIDGLPLSNSSLSQVHSILCLINNIDVLLPLHIFLWGIFYDKPSDYNAFLEEFVSEAVDVTIHGKTIDDNYYSFKISMLLFDAVAKPSIHRIKGHSGYSSCSKCTQEG